MIERVSDKSCYNSKKYIAAAGGTAAGLLVPRNVVLSGDDEIDGLRTLALFVGFDVEADALPLNQ
jgi:hypothetical protein